MENKIERLERLIDSKKNVLDELEERRVDIQASYECVYDEITSLNEELKSEIRKRDGTNIPKERWGVHETHCCKRHGCKYGQSEDCPVELGLIKQLYGCETGDDFDEDCFEENINLQPKYDEYKSALESIELLTKGSSNGEIFRIHEIVKKVLE
jgi:hypothetical protein